jgi:uncharacterized membrane protein YdjX (TVP38/TMEM64 family)
MRRYWLLALAMIALLLALFALAEALQLPLLQAPDRWLASGGAAAAALSVGLLVADVLLPIPSSVILVANGALFGVAGGTALSLLGSLGAAAFGFALGRRGSRVIERLATPAQKARADALLARWGALAVLVTRPVPLLAETTVILAGASPMGWARMLAASAAGALPACLLYAITGATSHSFATGAIMFTCVLALAGLFYWLGRRGLRQPGA